MAINDASGAFVVRAGSNSVSKFLMMAAAIEKPESNGESLFLQLYKYVYFSGSGSLMREMITT